VSQRKAEVSDTTKYHRITNAGNIIMKHLLATTFVLVALFAQAQQTQRSTYCNPLNIDYTYMIYNAYKDISYRSGADPAVVQFRGEYYMFVTRSLGYWHSTDLLHWHFIKPQRW